MSENASELWAALRQQCEDEYEQSFGVRWDKMPKTTGRWPRSWPALCREGARIDRQYDGAQRALQALRAGVAEARTFMESAGIRIDKSLLRRSSIGHPAPEFVLMYLFARYLEAMSEVERIAGEATGPRDVAAIARETAGRFADAEEYDETERGRALQRELSLLRALRRVVYGRPCDVNPPRARATSPLRMPRQGTFRPMLEPPRGESGSISWRRGWLVDVLESYPLDPARPGASRRAYPTDREIAVVNLLLSNRDEIAERLGKSRTAEDVIVDERKAINVMLRRRAEPPVSWWRTHLKPGTKRSKPPGNAAR